MYVVVVLYSRHQPPTRYFVLVQYKKLKLTIVSSSIMLTVKQWSQMPLSGVFAWILRTKRFTVIC